MSSLESFSVVVAHPGKQHSQRLAVALEQSSSLSAYFTTVFDCPDSKWLKALLKIFSRNDAIKSRLGKRSNSNIPGYKVRCICELSGLVSIALYGAFGDCKLYRLNERQLNKRFQKKVARYVARAVPDALVMYERKAGQTFRILKKKCIKTRLVLDLAAANPEFVNEEINRLLKSIANPSAFHFQTSATIAGGKEILEECSMADMVIVPSDYSKNSFEYSGVASEKIHVCPFGPLFPEDEYVKETYTRLENSPLEVVYCGRVEAKKGIHDLLEAVTAFDPSSVHLTIIGRYDRNDDYLKRFSRWADYYGQIDSSKIYAHLRLGDLFIFPSYSDSMSFACLEAMAVGLPVACSSNTGMSFLIRDGHNGYVFKTGSVDQIRNIIKHYIMFPKELEDNGREARETVLSLNESSYAGEIRKSFSWLFSHSS